MSVHKLVEHSAPYQTKALDLGDQNAMITHQVHFFGTSNSKSRKNLEDPDQKICCLVQFAAVSAIGRPSHSRGLVFENKLYYCPSWKELYGEPSSQRTPKTVVNYHLVNFLVIETNHANIELVLNTIGHFGVNRYVEGKGL